MAYIDQLTNQIPPVNASQLYDVPDYPAQPIPLSPYSQPQQPTINPNGYIGRTLQQVAAKRQQDEAQNVLLPLIQNLRERMQPTTYDVSQSILRSATPDYYKATTPQDMAKERVENELTPYTTMLGLQAKLRQAQQNPAGATGELIDRLIRDNPGMTYTQALYAVQGSGMKRGLALDQNGNVIAQSGAPQALGALKFGETIPTEEGKKVLSRQYDPETEGMKAERAATAKAGVELGTVAEIEKRKKIGAGEITDVQKKQIGQEQLAPSLSTMSSLYDDLEKAKAAVVPGADPLTNLSASIRGGDVGQYLGKKFGTKEQSIRNQINQQIPAIINDIRQVTGMSAKAMDSNAELKFYLAQLGDPDADITARRAALISIQNKFLKPFTNQNPDISLDGAAPSNLPQGAATHKYNPATGQLEELR